MRPVPVILRDIENFQPTEDGNWLALDDLLQELWTEKEGPREALIPLFQLLERFPEDESAGVLRSILHGIESYPEYEAELVKSLYRHPTDITVTMVRRIANSGQALVAGQPIKRLYQVVIAHPKASKKARETAQDYLNNSR
ncbi:hypothetical protein FNT36_16700 [Hymenobacter setariae]|uniref:HEAT repeat domain-containing protein n=1 Tax=Hymenobacter setariae TaxID=2594794 RepID=A0A558BS02_9BACT|nr:hypothetical protein [Hymenobacter setariae]TVT39294.1 hypothetical protein FNT36_16700 [Hymenobacter setariae]